MVNCILLLLNLLMRKILFEINFKISNVDQGHLFMFEAPSIKARKVEK